MRELYQVTGGWAAGVKPLLQLDGPDSTAVASEQIARDPALLDYLSAEVFDRPSEGVRRFLLKVAHVPSSLQDPDHGGRAQRQRRGYGDSRRHAPRHPLPAMHEIDGELHYEFHPPCCVSFCSCVRGWTCAPKSGIASYARRPICSPVRRLPDLSRQSRPCWLAG
jgi:hypothetical protein